MNGSEQKMGKRREKQTWRPLNAQSVPVIHANGAGKKQLFTKCWRNGKKELKICGEDGRLTVAARDENE